MNGKRKTIGIMASFFIFLFSGSTAGLSGPNLDEKKIEEIIKKVSPSVVKVEVSNRTKRVATGVVVDKSGHIVTTALISPRDEEITIINAAGKRMKAEFLGMDTETHLAVVRAKDKSLAPITLSKEVSLSPGTWIGVVCLSPENSPAITQGIVSSVAEDKLRLNVWVVPGSSGSAVVNREGQMVGLLRGIYTEDKPVVLEIRERELVASGYIFSRAEAPASGMALAVPVDVVKTVSEEIKKTGKVERGWLGVSIAENEEGRVEIIEIVRQSPAELARLEVGDIILRIDGKDIRDSAMLASEIRKRKPDQEIKLEVQRQGKSVEVKVHLGEYPEHEARRELEKRFPRLFPPELPPDFPREPALPRPGWDWEKRKFIGVYLDEINRELSAHFGVKEGRGLLVSRFSENSPTEKAGLKIGDVIVKADGKRVESVAGLSGIIQDKKKGDKILIEFIRDKKVITVEVGIEEEERRGFFPFRQGEIEEDLKKYWEDYSRLAQEQLKKWREEYGGEFMEKTRKLDEEISRIYKDLADVHKEETEKFSMTLKRIHRI